MATQKKIGGPGCFAPPITDEDLERYEQLAEAAPAAMAHEMRELIQMVRVFRETPATKERGMPAQVELAGGRTARVDVAPLEKAEVERIWDLVPWDHECTAIAALFETLPYPLPEKDGRSREERIASLPEAKQTQVRVKDAAVHLLWFARELCADREPLTSDKLE